LTRLPHPVVAPISLVFFFFQAEDGIRDLYVTGVQTCALPISFLHPDLDFRVRFPAGWKTANERTVVGASAPDGRAVVGLELVGKGSDPEAALRAFQEEAKIDLAPGAERLMVGGLPAIHATTTARTRAGRVALDLTWIAHAERIYRVIGAASPDGAAAAEPFFRATVESFRPLTASER